MTDPVPAADTGLPAPDALAFDAPAPDAPAFDRRSFLATLAAAGVLTGGAALAAPTMSADHPDAELLDLSVRYARHKALEDAYDAASAEAFDRYVPPPVPDALFWRPSDTPHVCCMPERCAVYVINEVDRLVYEQGAPDLNLWAQSFATDASYRHSLFGDAERERVREILEAHAAWMVEIVRAEDAAGITGPSEAARRESQVLAELHRSIVLTPARTLEGLIAKAVVGQTAYVGSGAEPGAIRDILVAAADSARVTRSEILGMSLTFDAAALAAMPQASSASVAA